MDEMNKKLESEVIEEEVAYEGVLNETADQDVLPEGMVAGIVHISEDVLSELAKKTLVSIEGVQPASPGIASKLGLGRKASEGVRVTLEDGIHPVASVDVYIMVKFGLRIPDLAWDVQELIKKNIEEYTGYKVKAVNVNVQGIYFKEKEVVPPEAPAQEEAKPEAKPEVVKPPVVEPAPEPEPEKSLQPDVERL
jgi:uncharacterized alkaline shock family protein YloU